MVTAMRRSKVGLPNALGELIAKRREELGLSPADLARETKIASAQISRLESGQRSDPHLSTLKALSRVLGLTLDEMGQAASRPPGGGLDYVPLDGERAITPLALHARLSAVEGLGSKNLAVARRVGQIDDALQILLNSEVLPETLRDRLRESLEP